MNKKLLLILLFIFVLGIVGCGAPKKEITSITIDIEYLEIEVGEDGVFLLLMMELEIILI